MPYSNYKTRPCVYRAKIHYIPMVGNAPLSEKRTMRWVLLGHTLARSESAYTNTRRGVKGMGGNSVGSSLLLHGNRQRKEKCALYFCAFFVGWRVGVRLCFWLALACRCALTAVSLVLPARFRYGIRENGRQHQNTWLIVDGQTNWRYGFINTK
jgi:hypothetical protein